MHYVSVYCLLNCSANEDLNARQYSWVKERPNHVNRIFSLCVCMCVRAVITQRAHETTFVRLKSCASPHFSSFSCLTRFSKSGWTLKYINHTIWSCLVSPAKQMSNTCRHSLFYCYRVLKAPAMDL